MRKYTNSIILGTITNLFIRDVKPTREGQQPTKAVDMTVAFDAQLNGRSVPAYVPVTMIGKQVEFLTEDGRLKEGANVFVAGEIKEEHWEVQQEGSDKPQKFRRTKLAANRIEIADPNLARTEPDAKQRTRVAQGLNHSIVAGNLTAAPDLRKTPSGDPVGNFTVAMNSKYTDRAGNEVEEVSFIDVVVWRTLAEQAYRELKKGSAVVVTGGLVTENWTDKDGHPRQSLKLEATTCSVISVPAQTEQQSAAPEPTEADLPPVNPDEIPTEDLPF